MEWWINIAAVCHTGVQGSIPAASKHRVFLECAGPQNSCDHLNEMAPQQLPADSLSAWPREAACIISTVAVDATPVLSSGHKDFVVQRSLFYELVSLVCLFSDHSEIELSFFLNMGQPRPLFVYFSL